MFDLSPIQLVLVLVIALFAIGPKRLPEVGRTIGRTMREVRGVISLDADHEDADRQARTPARGEPSTADTAAEPARPVAVGGEDVSSSPAVTEEADPPDVEADDVDDQTSEVGTSAADMVVRGRRNR